MRTYWLCFTLCSDATFGRGEGLAGLVDQEVDHDRYGLPYLRGRALKGLLNEECANILFVLEQQLKEEAFRSWQKSAQRLFGAPGSLLVDEARLRVGNAQLPADLREAVCEALQDETDETSALQPADILESLTAIRRQTAVDEVSGTPEDGTLRAMRVVVRQTPFEARLSFRDAPSKHDLALLGACILAFRRAGTGRNRGRGRLEATLHADQEGRPGEDITQPTFAAFAQEVRA